MQWVIFLVRTLQIARQVIHVTVAMHANVHVYWAKWSVVAFLNLRAGPVKPMTPHKRHVLPAAIAVLVALQMCNVAIQINPNHVLWGKPASGAPAKPLVHA